MHKHTTHPFRRAAFATLRFTLNGTGLLLTGTGTALQFCGSRLSALAARIGETTTRSSGSPESSGTTGAPTDATAAATA